MNNITGTVQAPPSRSSQPSKRDRQVDRRLQCQLVLTMVRVRSRGHHGCTAEGYLSQPYRARMGIPRRMQCEVRAGDVEVGMNRAWVEVEQKWSSWHPQRTPNGLLQLKHGVEEGKGRDKGFLTFHTEIPHIYPPAPLLHWNKCSW